MPNETHVYIVVRKDGKQIKITAESVDFGPEWTRFSTGQRSVAVFYATEIIGFFDEKSGELGKTAVVA